MSPGPHALSAVTYALVVVLTILGIQLRGRGHLSRSPTPGHCIMVGTMSLPVIIFGLGLLIEVFNSMSMCACPRLTPDEWATDRDMAVLSITSLSFLLSEPRMRKAVLVAAVVLLWVSLIAG